jgi:Rieske Fe-S protein
MKRDPSITQSVWMREQLPQFPTLNHDLEVDVVIVGAGLTGITAAYLLRQKRDRLAPAQSDDLSSVRRGEGQIVSVDGQKMAAYRSEAGEITLLSPVCTHLKCLVRWNAADRTWDCPCHGSRFHPDGSILSGPAEEPLSKEEPSAKAE